MSKKRKKALRPGKAASGKPRSDKNHLLKRPAFLAGSVLLLVVAVLCFVFLRADSGRRAIDSAFDYLIASAPLEPDVYMLAGLSALSLGDEKLQERVRQLPVKPEGAAWMREATLALAFEPRMTPLNKPRSSQQLVFSAVPVPLTPMTNEDLELLFWLVSLSLLCREATPEEIDKALSLASYSSHGYVLTHQLFALEAMVRLGCVSEQSVVTRISELASKVSAETFPQLLRYDLDYERVAMLVLAGYSEQLRTLVYDALIENQNADGSWAESEVIVNSYGAQKLSSEHATALALFALVGMYQARSGN